MVKYFNFNYSFRSWNILNLGGQLSALCRVKVAEPDGVDPWWISVAGVGWGRRGNRNDGLRFCRSAVSRGFSLGASWRESRQA